MPSLSSLTQKNGLDTKGRKRIERKGPTRPWENSEIPQENAPKEEAAPELALGVEPVIENILVAGPAVEETSVSEAEAQFAKGSNQASEMLAENIATAEQAAQNVSAVEHIASNHLDASMVAEGNRKVKAVVKRSEKAETAVENTFIVGPVAIDNLASGLVAEKPTVAAVARGDVSDDIQSQLTPRATGATKNSRARSVASEFELDHASLLLLSLSNRIGAEATVRYLVLKQLASNDGGHLSLSQQTVATIFKISHLSAKRMFALLEEENLIVLEKEFDPKDGSPRLYRFIEHPDA